MKKSKNSKRICVKRIKPKTASRIVMVFNIIASILLLGACLIEISIGKYNWVLALVFVIVLIEMILGIQGHLAYVRTQEQAKNLEIAVAELESLNKSMKAQRHDFKNHMQVVMSLIEMNEYAEAKKYLNSVSDDFAVVSRAMRTSIPALNAFLSAKQSACIEQGIIFEMEVTSSLEDLSIETWEICSILGNLIDNAIEAMNSEESNKQKKMLLNISELMGLYHISVENNGPKIPAKYMSKIFKPGYSSKKEDRGVGLPITAEIVGIAGGKIDVFSSDVSTKFVVRLPKKTK